MVNTGPASPGILVQKTNHSTGKLEWKMMPEDYDYNQELARAAFADMLHDSERNQLYRKGLVAAIKQLRDRGEEVHVLDIGTGTGLLSMMACVAGADSVTACEEFRPMAECAARIIEDNGFQDKIKLVRKRSTDLKVGPGLDMERRANILVTEVFDTELIGEGAISTYNHANTHLLTQDRLVVPPTARIFAQVVRSKKCSEWSRLLPIRLGNGEYIQTRGTEAISNLVLHDLQLSQLKESLFTPITPPVQVFKFDLACREGNIPVKEQQLVTLPASESGDCDAVLMWWDCWTDPEETILLSCAPKWAHPSPTDMPWRDHWMQAVYYPSSKTTARKGEELTIVANHDEYSLWFDVVTAQQTAAPEAGGCLLPMSRLRLGEVNCTERNSIYASVLRDLLANFSQQQQPRWVLALGDQSVLGLMAAKLSGKDTRVVIVTANQHMQQVLRHLATENSLADRLEIFSDDTDVWTSELSEKYGLLAAIIGDPFYTVSVLPWHNLLFWYTAHQVLKKLPDEERLTVRLSPWRANLWILPVHYAHLWKIRAPLHTIEGFNMRHFDTVIDKASEGCDAHVEPHPLWEYPALALGLPTKVGSFDLREEIPGVEEVWTGELAILSRAYPLNGLALWISWDLDEERSVSSGPVSTVSLDEEVEWTMDSKQGVHFFKQPDTRFSHIVYRIVFQPTEGDFTFAFEPR